MLKKIIFINIGNINNNRFQLTELNEEILFIPNKLLFMFIT